MRSILFVIGKDGCAGVDIGDVITPIYNIAGSCKKVWRDLAQDDLVEPDIVILHGIHVADPGIGAQAKASLWVFHKVDVPYEVKFIPFGPDIGFEGDGELFVLGIGCAGSNGGDP